MRETLTISLQPAMRRKAERLAKVEHRTTSELIREALRLYFDRAAHFPEEAATPAEVRARNRGRRQIARGDYVTLDQLKRELAKLDTPRRPRRAQKPAARARA